MLPPVAITLVANVTEAAANIEKFGAQVGGMGAETTAMGAKVSEGFSSAGVTIDEFGKVAMTTAEEASAANDKILASMARLSAQADRTAEQWYVDQTKMAAATQKMVADLEAAEAKAVASTEAMGAKMDEVAATSTGFGAKVESASKRLMTVGAAGAVVGVAAVKMAADFESSTARLVTSAGETQANLAKVRQGILDMAGQVGYSAEELSKSLYTIESGGQHGADGLTVLRAAAEGAKTENAELKTVADAVTSVLQDYHLKAEDAASVTSKLVAATSAGKTTFEELAGSMSAVLPVASAAGVSIDDVLGSLASMTVHGMSAQQAAQNLTDVIRHMQSPTQVQSKELALLGMNAGDLGAKLKSAGISGTLQEISDKIQSSMGPNAQKVVLDLGTALKSLPKDVQDLGQKLIEGTITQKDFTKAAQGMNPIAAHQAASFATLAASTHTIGTTQMSGAQVMQNYGQALNKATGDATGLNVALMLTGENTKTTKNAVNTVSSAAVEAGNHVKGWSEIQSTFNQKMSQAKDGLGAMAISVGERLLPVASKLLEWLGSATSWFSQNKVAADALAVAIGVLALGGIVGLIGKLGLLGASLVKNLATPVIAGVGFLKNFATAAEGTAGGAVANFAAKLAGGAVSGVKAFGSALVDGAVAMGTMGKAAAAATVELVAQGAAWIAQKIAVVASTVAEGAMTAAQWLLNFAMDANPIGAVILIIGVLITVITLIVTHLDVVRKIWDTVWKWCSDRISDFVHWVSARWDDIIGFFKSLPDKVKQFLSDAGEWLINAGKAILEGLLNGLKKAWNAVTGFIGGIGKWISDHKGPIEYDRQLLVPHGNAIMDGLHEGLKSGGRRVQSYLDDFTTGIGNTAIGGHVSIGDGALAGPAGSLVRPMPEQLVFQMNARDVQTWLQTGTLRYNMRNSSNGLAVSTS
jgi:hypothetical protein